MTKTIGARTPFGYGNRVTASAGVGGAGPEATATASPARPPWALAVVIALVVGITGLTANPVQSHNQDGTYTLRGTFEPYRCAGPMCNGYLQAGARSVFVQFPNGCPPPVRGSTITVTARSAPDLGTASYRATHCG